MLQYITDRSPEVRQAAAYGCGVMGKFGGPQFAQACLRKSFLSFYYVTKLPKKLLSISLSEFGTNFSYHMLNVKS